MGSISSIPLGWTLVPGAIIAAGATFAVGANDVGNALGTSLGSRALSLRSAIILGGFMEFLGIVSLGQLVGGTLKAGIVDPEAFSNPQYYVVGMFSVLAAAFVWLLAATLLGLPVSTTHTIVAGIFAFGVFEIGASAVNVNSVISISISWIASPLSGFVAAYLLYWLLHHLVIARPTARQDASAVRKWVDLLFPILAGATCGFMVLLVLIGVRKAAGDNGIIPVWVLAVIPVVLAVLAWALTFWVLLPRWYQTRDVWAPRIRKVLLWGDTAVQPPDEIRPVDETDGESSELEGRGEAEIVRIMASPSRSIEAAILDSDSLFVSLMVMTAALVAFAHSANDIANSVAPFMVIYEWYTTQELNASFNGPTWYVVGAFSCAFFCWFLHPLHLIIIIITPNRIYIVSGLFLVLGLVCLGYIVMRTIGEKVTKLSHMAGFVAQLSASLVVIIATLLGLPISTTHTIVGAITGVGAAVSFRNIQWMNIGKICLGWIFTILIGAGLTLAFYAPLRLTVHTNTTRSNF